MFPRFCSKQLVFGLVAVIGVALAGCGSDGNGTLALSLTDQENDQYQAVYVTIIDVQVHAKGQPENSENGWMSLPDFEGPQTINLLELRDGVIMGLGSIELEPGEYTQMRLIIGDEPDDDPNILCLAHFAANYVVDQEGNQIEMKIPSGPQTGIKVVCSNNCVINEDETTEWILDFDAEASVVELGNGGLNLKPTIKLLTTEDFALLTGTITEDDEETPIENAMVTAQTYDPGAGDPKDVVLVWARTKTDGNGEYRLLLRPDDYNIVITAAGHEPSAFDFLAAAGDTSVEDVSLDESDFGTVAGLVTISSTADPLFVHTSFENDAVHSGETVEIDSRDTLNGDQYSVGLPVMPNPNYQVISSTCNEETLTDVVEVVADDTTTLDVTFPAAP